MALHEDRRTPEEILESKQVVGEVENEAMETLVGAAAGAAIGIMAGPIGIAVGASLGAVAGAALGHQLKKQNREEAEHDRDLAADIVDEPLLDEPPPDASLAKLEVELDEQAALEKPLPFHGTR